jgi:hypothetical protein
MSTGPETEVPEPAESLLPGADEASVTLPIADGPVRRPRLDGRAVRSRKVIEVRWRVAADAEVESALLRREPAAFRLAGRLRAQGYPVTVAVGAISSWSVIG